MADVEKPRSRVSLVKAKGKCKRPGVRSADEVRAGDFGILVGVLGSSRFELEASRVGDLEEGSPLVRICLEVGDDLGISPLFLCLGERSLRFLVEGCLVATEDRVVSVDALRLIFNGVFGVEVACGGYPDTNGSVGGGSYNEGSAKGREKERVEACGGSGREVGEGNNGDVGVMGAGGMMGLVAAIAYNPFWLFLFLSQDAMGPSFLPPAARRVSSGATIIVTLICACHRDRWTREQMRND